jgi:hypothetical protein
MAWRSRHCVACHARVGSGLGREAVSYTGYDTTSPRTLLGSTGHLEGCLANRPLA